jgi:hypothetical protein
MPASFNQGSINFGPVNADARTYTLPSFVIPDSNWVIAIQFDTGPLRGPSVGDSTGYWLCGTTGITAGTGGGDWGIGYVGGENSATPAAMRFGMRVGGTNLVTPSAVFNSSSNALLLTNRTYWAFFVRNGSTIEYWLCPANGTATLLGTGTYNASFGSRTLAASSFGTRHRGAIGTFFVASGSFNAANMESVASGQDPDTIVLVGDRRSFLSFVSPTATITNDWGGGTATQAGTWTNRPSGSPLQYNVTGNQLRLEYLKSYRVFPRRFNEAKSFPVLTGTYHNYTPTAAQFRVLNSTLGVAKDWTSFTSFTASGGTWSGVADIDEGGPYFIQVRDTVTTTIQYLGDTPVYVAPAVASTGQSPMARIDDAQRGVDTLTGTLLLSYRGIQNSNLIEPALIPSAEAPVGLCALANQFSADTGGRPIAYTPTAVGGTGIGAWAGYSTLTLATIATYTVGETVEIRTSGNVLRGTGRVVSSAGSSLVVEYLTVTPVATDLVVGLTSGLSRTVNASSTTGTDIESTFPPFLSRLDACDIKNGDVAFYWLNGSNDTGTSQGDWNIMCNSFWNRLQSACAARGINPRLFMVPHNRQTSSADSANFSIRRIQRNWAISHPDYNTKIFLGWHYHDMPIIGELVGTAQGGTSTSITLPADYDGVNVENVANITITAGTGVGQTRTGTTYNATTKVQTVTPAWSTIPDNTSQFSGWTTGPHQNRAGYRSGGVRYGRSIANRYGYINRTDQGPTITNVWRNNDGTVLTVRVSHTHGMALRTRGSGFTATNVFGFEVSDNNFSSVIPITSAQITGASTVTITLGATPSNLPGLQVRYLWGFPVAGQDFQRLNDILYDSQAIESNRGQLLQNTWDPITAVQFTPPTITVNPNGWSTTYLSPPTEFDPINSPVTVSIQRQGYTTSGTTTTYPQTLTVTRRIRRPAPNHATLTQDQAALSDYVYSTDTFAAGTNNSTEISPTPICQWGVLGRRVIGNSLYLELVAFHYEGRNREQVAAVEFTATDGSAIVTQVVGTSNISQQGPDMNPVIVYSATLDLSTLADGDITVNARVFPWIGAAASIANSATGVEGTRGFNPLLFVKNPTLFANPPLVYVSLTGTDDTVLASGATSGGTQKVSTNPVTAKANPFATVVSAVNALRAATTLTGGFTDGCEVRFMTGTHTSITAPSVGTYTNKTALTITRDPDVALNAVTLSTSSVWSSRQGRLDYRDVQLVRTVNTGFANVSSALRFIRCTIDGGSFPGAFTTSAVPIFYYYCRFLNVQGSALQAGAAEQRQFRGCDFVASATIEGWSVIGCRSAAYTPLAFGTRNPDGLIIAYNNFRNVTGAIVTVSGSAARFAIVQNVVEYISATSNPAFRLSGDADTNSLTHVVYTHNTIAGAFAHGRVNIGYNDTNPPLLRSHKFIRDVGNIYVQRNTKHDIFAHLNDSFADASDRIGGWATMYGVGSQGNYIRYVDAGGSVPGQVSSFNQVFAGFNTVHGTSSTVPLNPLFVDDEATQPGSIAGLGNGDYRIQAGSPAAALAIPTIRFDLVGATRPATLAAAGAYEPLAATGAAAGSRGLLAASSL